MSAAYHDRFYTFDAYFGLIANDELGTKVFGYETQSPDHRGKAGASVHLPAADGGCFAYVHSGAIQSYFNGGRIELRAGVWCSTEAGFSFEIGEDSRIAVFQRCNYRGVEAFGKLEASGRLRYIDGCWDTVVFGPLKLGLPCINALYVPPGVHQTMHTHPSTRAGLIISGHGTCQTNTDTHLLRAGSIFYLPQDGWHKFRTDTTRGTITLIAFHPDSDFGPTDDDHPMLNRTIVDGVSAKVLPTIQTAGATAPASSSGR